MLLAEHFPSQMHVDQMYVNFLPCFFGDDLKVLTHLGANVAYWNLFKRGAMIHNDKGSWEVENDPLLWYHFSGFSPVEIRHISRHQNRFVIQDFPQILPLFEQYQEELEANDALIHRMLPYGFSYFDGAGLVPDVLRKFLHSLVGYNTVPTNFSRRIKENFLDGSLSPPGSNLEEVTFLEWSLENICGPFPTQIVVPRILFFVYSLRKDLQDLAPRVLESIEASRILLSWFRDHFSREFGFQPHLISDAPTFVSTKPRPRIHSCEMGVNLIGWIHDEFGIGEVSRIYYEAFESAGVPVQAIDLALFFFSGHRSSDRTLYRNQTRAIKFPYCFTVLAINADNVVELVKKIPEEAFRQKYIVSLYTWELEVWPKEFLHAFDYVDEIWPISEFTAASMRSAEPQIPIISVPLVSRMKYCSGVTEEEIESFKSKFSIGHDDVVFYVIFDFASFRSRKNPEGAIKSFLKMERMRMKSAPNAWLFVKTTNGFRDPTSKKEVSNLARGSKHILFIDEVWSVKRLCILKLSGASYLSLHRSEGSGLNLIESMSLGIPVVATKYGANLEYMSQSTGYLINFQRTLLNTSYSVVKPGEAEWAEPDQDHAATVMLEILQDPLKAKTKGSQAKKFMQDCWSTRELGVYVRRRLTLLHQTILSAITWESDNTIAGTNDSKSWLKKESKFFGRLKLEIQRLPVDSFLKCTGDLSDDE
jgi:glycosyltransferase involved in cell wall biosynthesis